MPIDHRAPNINARRLGLYLRTIREFLGLSYEQAAGQVGCQSEWLVRGGTGVDWPSPAEGEGGMDRYPGPDPRGAQAGSDPATRAGGAGGGRAPPPRGGAPP